MRSSNTFGIQFVIRLSKQQKNDPATVFARISVNGRRCEISLKRKVDPKSWDEAKGKARGTKEEIRTLNEHIERVRTIVKQFGICTILTQLPLLKLRGVFCLGGN
jgi:hypothetical protein